MGFLDSFSGGAPADNDAAVKYYEDLYQNQQPHHESSLTHEGLAAAAGFAAMHAYESHLRASGEEVSHAKMKEFVAAIAAAEIDKLVETKGLDWVDKHKAHKMAEQQAHQVAQQRYGAGGNGWDYAQQRDGPRQQYQFGGYGPYGGGGGYGAPAGAYGGGGGGYPAPPPPQGYFGGPPPPQGFGGYPGGGGIPPPADFDECRHCRKHKRHHEKHHHNHRHDGYY